MRKKVHTQKNTGKPACTAGSCCCSTDGTEEKRDVSVRQLGAAGMLFAAGLAYRAVLRETALIPLTTASHLAELALFLAAYLICGRGVIKNAVWNLLHGHVFDEQFLMSLASIGAVCIGEYPEAVAVMLFYQIGEYFQDYAVGRSRRSISELMKLRPDRAVVLENGKPVERKPEEVQQGQIILVKPGERIPLDGTVTDGTSSVNTAAQTGEPVPRAVFAGTDVLAGFVNMQGVLKIRVTRPYGESSLVRIFELVERAVKNKAESERFITRFSRIYTPAVCAAALLLAAVPPLVTGTAVQLWLGRALIFLVVSCPCALVISVPLTFFGGIGAASAQGILVKGSNYLESLARTGTVVFDKTGTLTKGVFMVTAIHPNKTAGISAAELVAIAAHAEKYSNHPISKSLREAHHGTCCEQVTVDNTEEIAGRGLRVRVDGHTVLAGNLDLMKESGVQGYVPCPEHDAGTIVHVAVDGTYAGHIVISDELKEDAQSTIRRLKKLGVRHTLMLTGDSRETGERTAQALGIDTVFAGLLPGDKVRHLEAVMAETGKTAGSVVYVGDGINDAPVLARADVGVAMNALGSDAAMEAADVVIMTDEPSKLADAITTARRTLRIARQNIVFALAVKAGIMVLGATGIAGMWAAVFGDVGVTFLAVLNALRLLRSPAHGKHQ